MPHSTTSQSKTFPSKRCKMFGVFHVGASVFGGKWRMLKAAFDDRKEAEAYAEKLNDDNAVMTAMIEEIVSIMPAWNPDKQ